MILSKTCAKILRDFEIEQQKVMSYRLGQHFCNMYIKGQWPELFYGEDRQKNLIMIEKWLKDNCYQNDMPPVVRTPPVAVEPKVIQCGTEVYCK
jgi:hypothetical protein